MSHSNPETKARRIANSYYKKPGVTKIQEYLALNPGRTVSDYADGLMIAFNIDSHPLSAWIKRELIKIAEQDLRAR